MVASSLHHKDTKMTNFNFKNKVPLTIAALGGVFMAYGIGGFLFGAFLFFVAAILIDRYEALLD